MSLAKCSILNPYGAFKRGSEDTILGRKIDLKDHQISISNWIGIGRGLAQFGEQELGGSEAPRRI